MNLKSKLMGMLRYGKIKKSEDKPENKAVKLYITDQDSNKKEYALFLPAGIFGSPQDESRGVAFAMRSNTGESIIMPYYPEDRILKETKAGEMGFGNQNTTSYIFFDENNQATVRTQKENGNINLITEDENGNINLSINKSGDINVKTEKGNLNFTINGDVVGEVEGKVDIKAKGEINVESDSTVNIKAQSVNIDCDVNVNGTVTSNESIIGGIVFTPHVHGGIMAGGAKTSVPE